MILGWLGRGLITGLIIWFLQRRDVLRLPAGDVQNSKKKVAVGAVFRWFLSAALLVLALRVGIFAGLAAFSGLMTARWIGILSLQVFPLQVNHQDK